jgi:hypothetical protein
MGKLGQLLVARGWITVQQLTRALQNQNAVGGRVGTCLLEMDVLGEDLLARSLAEQLGVPAAVIEDLRGIPDEVLRLIPEKLARRCRAIPFRLAGGRLDVAMQDPRNLVCQDEIAFACGRRVKVHVLHELRIYEALQRYYREDCPSRYSLLLDRLNRARYLWGAKESAGRHAPGTPAAQRAQTAPAAPDLRTIPGTPAAGRAGGAPGVFSAEDRAEVLSALPSEGLLAEAPRMQPPPLPEPELPPTPRRRSLFRSRSVEAPAPQAAGASEGVRELPPLEELDLRSTAPPRRQRGQPEEAEGPAATLPPEAPPAAAPAPPPVPLPVQAPAAAPPIQPAASVAASAAAGARPAGAPPPPDLEATLALGPRAARTPRPADVMAPRETAAPRHERAEVPHEKVAITEAERAELGLAEAPAAGATAPPASPREAPATIEEVEAAFAETTDSEEVGRILLGFLARSFRRVALFQATREHVSAWMARGDGIDQEAFARYGVSFKEPSVFLNLRQGSGIHIGPLPPMATHRELALCWGGGLPRDCVVLPVRLMDRLVTVLYMDGGSRGLGGIDLEQMHRLTAATAAAFERCILGKKRGYAQS